MRTKIHVITRGTNLTITPKRYEIYRQICYIRRTKSHNLDVSRLALQLSLCNLLKPGLKFKNEDVVGAAPTGDAPTTSEWSIIVLPTEVRFIRIAYTSTKLLSNTHDNTRHG